MSKYRKRLDRSRDYGEVYGSGVQHRFEQDGFAFNHEGVLVDAMLTPDQVKTLEAAAQKRPPAAPKPVQKLKPVAAAPAVDPADDGVNLELFLKGEADYPLIEVRKAVKERYSKACTKLVDVLDFLVEDQRLVPFEDLAEQYKKVLRPAGDK